MMEVLIYILVVATVSIFVLIIHGLVFGKRQAVLERFAELRDSYRDPADDSIMHLPFNERIIKPAYQKFANFIGQATPNGMKENFSKLIAHAGSPSKMTVNRLVAIMLMTGILFSVLVFVLLENILFIILIGIIGLVIPIYIMRGMATKRQTQIQKSLPDMLDLIYVSVEAGLGFDMALKRTSDQMPGPLAHEFNKALDEINKGKKRDEAFRAIGRRTGVDDLSTFISAVIQSEQLGSNIANMLRVQSASMRQKRRQRAEEKAMKISVKMLFPLVFFMFPALFIIILGPAMITIIEVLGDMF